MKKIIFTVFLSLPLFLKAQTADYAHVNLSKDTLYLLIDSTLSKLTYQIWECDPSWKHTHPIILFVNQEKMKSLKREYESAEFIRMRNSTVK